MSVLGRLRIAGSDLQIGEAEEDDMASLIESDLHERIVAWCGWDDGVDSPGFADPPPVGVREICRSRIAGPHRGRLAY
jgi:hypothetical protein